MELTTSLRRVRQCLQLLSCTDEAQQAETQRRLTMSKKDDKAILKGMKAGGAKKAELVSVGQKYRRALMTMADGQVVTVYKIPSSSSLDTSALQRKGRDYAAKYAKLGLTELTW